MRRKVNTLKNQMRLHYLLSAEKASLDSLSKDQPKLVLDLPNLQLDSNNKSKLELGSRTVVSYKTIPGVSKLKVFKLILGLYFVKSELSVLEYVVLENLMSVLMNDKTHPFEIKQEHVRSLVTVAYIVLKYGGIKRVRDAKLSGTFLKAEYLKLGHKVIPTEKLPSLIKKYQIKLVLTTLPSPEINVPRFTKRYSGYCKGHPTPGRSGEAPLPLELQPTEDVEPHIVTQREYVFLFNCNTQLFKNDKTNSNNI